MTMNGIPATAALIAAFLNVSCSRDAVIVAPQGEWSASQITQKSSVVCRFPWVFDVAYEKGRITYSGPTVQSSPWLTTFSNLDSDSPKVIESDARGAHEITGFQMFRTAQRITIIRVLPDEDDVLTYTIDLKTGIAMLSEQKSWLLGPIMNATMGTCR
jgi:hypothetical protein